MTTQPKTNTRKTPCNPDRPFAPCGLDAVHLCRPNLNVLQGIETTLEAMTRAAGGGARKKGNGKMEKEVAAGLDKEGKQHAKEAKAVRGHSFTHCVSAWLARRVLGLVATCVQREKQEEKMKMKAAKERDAKERKEQKERERSERREHQRLSKPPPRSKKQARDPEIMANQPALPYDLASLTWESENMYTKKHARNVEEIYCYCGENKQELCDHCVQCDHCNQWFHTSCTSKVPKDQTKFLPFQLNYKFVCKRCNYPSFEETFSLVKSSWIETVLSAQARDTLL
jgi:hypothetical protein